jgi:hypothetical protein
MRWLRLLRPSPAMVVALIALLVALSGSAVAVQHFVISSKGQISPKVLKQLKGKRGLRGLARPRGLQGLQGPPGAPGANGTALAYAHVLSNGTVDGPQALNVANANVVKPALSTGFYCFANLSFTPHNAVVTLEEPFPVGETLGLAARVIIGPGVPFGCPAGTQTLVTIRKDAGGVEDHGFYILFN